MKLQTLKPAVPILRCTHRASSGRQCRLAVFDGQSGLCPRHYAQQKEKENADVSEVLLKDFQGFQTAQGINFTLRNLYWLVAQNRISARRAKVLAYISGLLLRTLPQIDADHAAGILDPTKPKPVAIPEPDPTKKPS
jgi:hypothetical protein